MTADPVHMRAADRMRLFDRMPVEWRAAARRSDGTRLEYRFAKGLTLKIALKSTRLDPLTLTDGKKEATT